VRRSAPTLDFYAGLRPNRPDVAGAQQALLDHFLFQRRALDPVFGDILMTNYRELNLTDRQRAMLDFTWKMTTTPWLIGDDDRQALYDVGFSPEDVYDIVDTVAYFNYTNRMTHGLGMLPNEDYFGMNRLPDPREGTKEAAE